MHAWYLRELYLNNRLGTMMRSGGGAADRLEPDYQPLYAVAAEDDHIAPWRETRIVNLATGPKRYTLSSSGHILGIINPPVSPPKRSFRAGDAPRRIRRSLARSHRPGRRQLVGRLDELAEAALRGAGGGERGRDQSLPPVSPRRPAPMCGKPERKTGQGG